MPRTRNGRTRDHIYAALAACAAALVLAGGPARAQGDAVRGEQLAKTWCAGCHVVDARGSGAAVDPAPPFPMMADKDPAIIQSRITRPHTQMPQFDLGRREVADLVAYIRSLGGAR